MTVIESEEVKTVRALQAIDRCDRCGAQAFMLAHKGKYELLFCIHHGRALFDPLTEQGFYIDDQSYLLNTQDDHPSVATVAQEG